MESGRKDGIAAEASPDAAFGPGGRVEVTGHRGAAGVAPENTLPSLRHAVNVGADAVEFDLQATRDGDLVLLHDDTVDRTTDGKGAVADMTLEEVRALDAGHRFSPDGGRTFPFRGRDLRVPTLEEGLAATEALPTIIDVKSARAGAGLADWIRGRPEAGRVLLGGFRKAALAPAAPIVRWRCAAEDELLPYVLLGKLGLGRRFAPDTDVLLVPVRRRMIRVLTRRFVRQAHRDRFGVHVWTINRPDRMRRLLDLGADGLITDFPARARRVLEGRAAKPRAM